MKMLRPWTAAPVHLPSIFSIYFSSPSLGSSNALSGRGYRRLKSIAFL
jgi:hypothetical protein